MVFEHKKHHKHWCARVPFNAACRSCCHQTLILQMPHISQDLDRLTARYLDAFTVVDALMP
jgi:hypothetical protein